MQSGRLADRQWHKPGWLLACPGGSTSNARPAPHGLYAVSAELEARLGPAARPSKASQLSDAALLAFERRGHAHTRQLLPRSVVLRLAEDAGAAVRANKLSALRQRIRVLCPGVDPTRLADETSALRVLRKKGTDKVGFLQFFNLHRSDAAVRQLAMSTALAGTAAELLGVKRVRLYQDCLFLKEAGFAATNWHSDLRMAPFDTNAYVTAWIPLRPILGGEADSGLLYASASHRDFALPFFHDLDGRGLDDRGYLITPAGAMELGDVAWHHGWLLHAAAPQPRGTAPRLALSVSYFADGARLLARRTDPSVHAHMLHSEDAESYEGWLSDVPDGGMAKHPALPIAFP